MDRAFLIVVWGLLGQAAAWADGGTLPDRIVADQSTHCSATLLSRVSQGRDFARLQDSRHIACGPLPADPGRALVVYLPPAAASGERDAPDDVDLFVVNPATGEVLASHVEQAGLYNGENVAFAAVSIDPAAYRVAPGGAAFGVRFSNTRAHGPHMGEEEDLALYLVRGDRVVPILPLLATRLSQASRDAGCPDGRLVNDAGFDRERVTLAVLETSSHGLADLEATLVRSGGAGGLRAGDCAPGVRPDRTRRYILHFDGRHYLLPPDLQPPGPETIRVGGALRIGLPQLPGPAR